MNRVFIMLLGFVILIIGMIFGSISSIILGQGMAVGSGLTVVIIERWHSKRIHMLTEENMELRKQIHELKKHTR